MLAACVIAMKVFSIFALVLVLPFSSSLRAEDQAPMLNRPGKILSQPDFAQPLGKEWSVGKGKWEPIDGVLTATEIPEEHHVAVLHLATGPVSLIIECEFRYNGGKIFYVGFDSASKHVGRVVIVPKKMTLCEDSTEVKGKTPSHTLAELPVDLMSDDWQTLRVEWTGEKMAARLNGKELRAENPYLATPKARWWFAAGGASVQLRNVRVTEGQPIQSEAR